MSLMGTLVQALPESLHSLKSLAQNAISQRQAAPPGFMEVGQRQERSSTTNTLSTSGPLGQKNDANVPPLLGVAPLGVVPLDAEQKFQFK